MKRIPEPITDYRSGQGCGPLCPLEHATNRLFLIDSCIPIERIHSNTYRKAKVFMRTKVGMSRGNGFGFASDLSNARRLIPALVQFLVKSMQFSSINNRYGVRRQSSATRNEHSIVIRKPQYTLLVALELHDLFRPFS